MSVRVLVLSSALLAAGCVSATPDAADVSSCPHEKRAPAAAAPSDADADAVEERDPEIFATRLGGTSSTLVRVSGQYITGPGISLGRYDEEDGRALRGRAEDSLVDLRIQDARVSGAIDNSPVELRVDREGSSLEMSGLIAGRVSRLKVDEDGMKGVIGTCSYDLMRAGTGFTGRRGCTGQMQAITVDMPDTMASWSDADVAAVFAVFLR
jgi:hypothetical protein